MKILITGWFGAGNAGDEAILLSELYAMRERIRDVEFHILSFGPEQTQRLTASIPEVANIVGIGSKKRFLKTEFRKLWRSLKDVDMVVVGGGGIFQDIYNHYPIPFFTSIIGLSWLLNKKVALHSVGIGPVRTWIGKRLCRIAANLADNITVRDIESRDMLLSLGVKKNIEVASDPVFLLKPVRTERVERLLINNGLTNGLKIGVCVQDLLFWSDENKNALTEALDHLIVDKGAKAAFIPFGNYRDGWVRKDSSDYVDHASARRLASMMRRKSIMIEEYLDPEELLSLIGKMDIIISMRLHGIIMGISMNVPVIGLTYRQETKLANLLKGIDQTKNLFIADEPLDKEKLLNQMKDILANKEHYRLFLKEKRSILIKKAEMGIESLLKLIEDDGILQRAAVS